MQTSGRYVSRVFAMPDPEPTTSDGWVRTTECDMRPAMEYAFRTLPGALRGEEPLGPCDDDRHEILVRRSSSDDRIRGLDWRLFDLCSSHVEQLLHIDDRASTSPHASRVDFRSDRPDGRHPIPSLH